jgi:uncharacterized protein YecT (DUF1311 family)
MKKTAIALAAALLCTAGAASAQQGLSSKYTSCMDRAHDNTVQLGMCAQTEIVAQDGRLNKAYQQVMRQLTATPAKRDALRARQRSWLKARDYECNIDGDTFDQNCVVEKTAARADELERMIRF